MPPCARALAMAAVALLLVASACREAPSPPPQIASVTRPLGSWNGQGSRTIGVVSESGRLRITWETTSAQPPGGGTFRLTVHSAVSGRPLQVVVDHKGEGKGTVNFDDDPRPYNLMVESQGLDWAFGVEETVAFAGERTTKD